MLTFSNKVLLIGFGAVARCTLPILVKHLSLDPTHITILDFEPNEAALKPWIEQGVTFVAGSRSAGKPGQSAGPVSLARRPAHRSGVEY